MGGMELEKRSAARRLLWTWGNAMETIRRKEEERQAYRQWANDARDTLRAQQMTGMPRGGGKRDLSDVIEETQRRAALYEEMEKRTGEEIQDILRLKKAVDEIISTMDTMWQRVLEYRYIDGHRWQYIAMKMNLRDESAARKIESRAADAVGEKIECKKNF